MSIYRKRRIALYLIILLIVSAIIFAFKNNNKSLTEIDISNVLSSYSFAGEKVYENIFDNIYADLIYKNNEKYESHIVSLKDGKEIKIENLVKSNKYEEFNEIVKSLCLKKFPSKVLDILFSNARIEYLFNPEYLEIYFYDYEEYLDTKRTFDIKINYKHIKDLLNFSVPGAIDFEDEDGFSYDESKTSVAFSFDDGPNGERTKKIIGMLEDYKMSATFYLVGYKIPNGKDAILSVVNSHSEIGYHTLNHKRMTEQSESSLKKDYETTLGYLKDITDKEFKSVRPPYGEYNNNALKAINLPFIRWNVDTNDWRYKDPNYTEKHVLEHIKNGNIILFHDSYNTTVEAIEKITFDLYLKDIQVLSISNLALLKNITLEPNKMYYNLQK